MFEQGPAIVILIYSQTHKTVEDDDCKTQFMILKSSIIMKHISNCAVYTDTNLLKCRIPISNVYKFHCKIKIFLNFFVFFVFKVERVFIWDLDETIILFHSLLTGTFATK